MIILKILGITLLIILGLILVVLLYVLFTPVGYDILGKWNGSRFVRFRIHDLLHIVSGRVIYDKNEGLSVSIKLFGFKELAGSGDGEQQEDASEQVDVSEQEDASEQVDVSEQEDASEQAAEDPGGEPETDAAQSGNGQEPAKYTVAPSEEITGSDPKAIAEDISKTDTNVIEDGIPALDGDKSLLTKFKETFTKQNIEAVRFILSNLFGFIKRILPHIKRINGDYSLGAPDLTGQSLGLFSCFPFMYKTGNWLRADFDSEDIYFDGELEAKGRIRLSWLAGALIRIMLNKNSRELVLKVIGG